MCPTCNWEDNIRPSTSSPSQPSNPYWMSPNWHACFPSSQWLSQVHYRPSSMQERRRMTRIVWTWYVQVWTMARTWRCVFRCRYMVYCSIKVSMYLLCIKRLFWDSRKKTHLPIQANSPGSFLTITGLKVAPRISTWIFSSGLSSNFCAGAMGVMLLMNPSGDHVGILAKSRNWYVCKLLMIPQGEQDLLLHERLLEELQSR